MSQFFISCGQSIKRGGGYQIKVLYVKAEVSVFGKQCKCIRLHVRKTQ